MRRLFKGGIVRNDLEFRNDFALLVIACPDWFSHRLALSFQGCCFGEVKHGGTCSSWGSDLNSVVAYESTGSPQRELDSCHQEVKNKSPLAHQACPQFFLP